MIDLKFLESMVITIYGRHLLFVLVSVSILEDWPKVPWSYCIGCATDVPLYYQLQLPRYLWLLFVVYISVSDSRQ